MATYAGPLVTAPDAGAVPGIDDVLAKEEKPPLNWASAHADERAVEEAAATKQAPAELQTADAIDVRPDTPLDGRQLFVAAMSPLVDPFADPLGKAKPADTPTDGGGASPAAPPSAGIAGEAGGGAGGGGGVMGVAEEPRSRRFFANEGSLVATASV